MKRAAKEEPEPSKEFVVYTTNQLAEQSSITVYPSDRNLGKRLMNVIGVWRNSS